MERIIENENCYFENIERVRLGLKLKKCDSDSDSDVNELINTPPQSEKKVLDKINEGEDYDNL